MSTLNDKSDFSRTNHVLPSRLKEFKFRKANHHLDGHVHACHVGIKKRVLRIVRALGKALGHKVHVSFQHALLFISRAGRVVSSMNMSEQTEQVRFAATRTNTVLQRQ